MIRMWWTSMACALALLLSSCGGGDGNSASPSAPGLAAAPAPMRLAANQPLASALPLNDANSLFAWAQENFPQLFAGPGSDGVAGPFSFRFYAQTQTYLALSSADGGVYVKGPVTGDQIVFIAPLTLLGCAVAPGSCPSITPGGSGTGNVAAAGERDWHTVALAAGQAYSFSLEGSSTAQGTLGDPLLRLFDSAGHELTSDDDSGTAFNSTLVCAPSLAGTYFLAAEGTGGDTGTYELSVTPVAGAAPACENRPADPGINWESPVSATQIIAGTVTLGPSQRIGAAFNVSGAVTAFEANFVAQQTANLYVLSSSELAACQEGRSFNFLGRFSPAGLSGFQSFALAPGSYAVCVVNETAQPNVARLELRQQTAAPGFHFSRNQFAPLVQTVAAGARAVQPVDAGDVFRIFIEGANTGGIFYIIPADQAALFLAGQPFQHFPELTAACGGLGAAGTAAPVLCELPGVQQYGIAYINDTATAQTIVVTGREYTPD